ncbi:MAG: ComEA family DNA-binding protein [Bacteroidota bacterium]
MLFKKIRRFVRSYFALTTRERRGSELLMVVILLFIGSIMVQRYFHNTTQPEFEPLIIEQLDLLEWQADSANQHSKFDPQHSSIQPKLFPFDPNTTSLDQWKALGLSEKQSSAILRFVEKGGRFRKADDLKRMYVIGADDYNRLAPYITITNVEPKNTISNPTSKSLILELNSADTIALCKLKGIGAGRARMIVRYREKLGGFVNLTQLLEVYTIDSSLYADLLPHLTLDTNLVRPLLVNSDSLNHPYLNQKMAKVVVNYRKQHGPFQSIDDLKQVKAIDSQTIERLAPYLRFE